MEYQNVSSMVKVEFPKAKVFAGNCSNFREFPTAENFPESREFNRGWRLDTLVDWRAGQQKVIVGKRVYHKVFSKHTRGTPAYQGYFQEVYASSKKEAARIRRSIRLLFPKSSVYIISGE